MAETKVIRRQGKRPAGSRPEKGPARPRAPRPASGASQGSSPAATARPPRVAERPPAVFSRIISGHDGGMDDHVFFATAARGTEPCLRDELREMRLRGVRCDRGGVHFRGSWEAAWRACLHSRVALRVLVELGRFGVTDGQSLYDAVRTIDWRVFLNPSLTLAVSAVCRDSELTHTNFIALKTKDAIVDRIRDEVGSRPDVNRDDPDVNVFVHLLKNEMTLYLDLSGQSLHKRGWRADHLEAPLKENLAAAMLRLSGWDRQLPLHDPMCGSGTIPIEAALWAARVAPGLSRDVMGFERWANFGDDMRRRMGELREEARDMMIRTALPMVSASDIDERAVETTRRNAAMAGVAIEVFRADVTAMQPLQPPGFVIVNPPYDVRLESSREFYDAMWRRFEQLDGHTVCVLAGDPEVDYPSRISPVRFQYLSNGDIECRFGVFEMPSRRVR